MLNDTQTQSPSAETQATPTPAQFDVIIPDLKVRLHKARAVALTTAQSLDGPESELESMLADVRLQWETKHEGRIAAKERADELLTEADADLRTALIDCFVATGVKTFDGQCSVRVNERLDYDANEATEWAKDNATFILTIDKKKFDTIAKDQTLPFVTKVSSYVAVVAKDLSDD